MAYWLNGIPSKGEPVLCASLEDAKAKLKRIVSIREGDRSDTVTTVWIEPEMKVQVTSTNHGVEEYSISFDKP